MTTAATRFEATLSRMDSVLEQRLPVKNPNCPQGLARRRAASGSAPHTEARRLIAERYDDAFRSFGTEVPAAVDDESPATYRADCLIGWPKLAPGHELAEIRADDVSGQPIVFDNFEQC